MAPRNTLITLALTLIVLLTGFSSAFATQPRNRNANVNRAVAAQKARANALARQLAVERALREREIRDFNRRLVLGSLVNDPFGRNIFLNPFVNRSLIFSNRNVGVRVGF